MGMKGKIALGAVVGVVVIGVVSANADSEGKHAGSDSSGKDSSASAAHRPGGKKDPGSAEAAEKKKAAFGGNGDYQVGSDIKPGTYRSSGNTDGMCYWERTKGASGDTDSVLANDNVAGTAVVTIRSTDAYFKTTGCGGWKKTA
ncbi:hypothetical protein [Streptomyces sp. BK340]|uniref:hypothetical protein n=1 Tax=Streptomyces sp. BK340 TaxID=2572903 RepID=UPI0011ACE639|nr:hypothetical protein [Streptomyces sp. BK340]TVZ98066.1 hypothetical protein FB157_102527 [Streptomyces sp. BK340]